MSLSDNPTNLTKIGREGQEAYQEGEREPAGRRVSLQSEDGKKEEASQMKQMQKGQRAYLLLK